MTPSPPDLITLALIQMSCSKKTEGNLDKAIRQIEAAKAKGAQIVCLQELFRSQYFCQSNNHENFEFAESIPGYTLETLAKTAHDHEIVIVGSLFEKASNKKYYNTAIVIDADGTFLGQYRKTHIPDDLENHYSEKYYFEPGDLGYKTFTTKFGKIGVLVCWDQWFPEAARALASAGAQIIFYPTSIGWPHHEKEQIVDKTEFDAWVTIQRSHAIANGVFVASCNRVGLENNIYFWGGSFICDPLGKILKQASYISDELVMAKCDLNRIQEIRKDWPLLTSRRTDIPK